MAFSKEESGKHWSNLAYLNAGRRKAHNFTKKSFLNMKLGIQDSWSPDNYEFLKLQISATDIKVATPKARKWETEKMTGI